VRHNPDRYSPGFFFGRAQQEPDQTRRRPARPEQRAQPGPWRRRLGFLLGAAVAAALLLVARSWWRSVAYVSTSVAMVEGDTVTIASPAEATVTEIRVRTGEHVRAGQLLARLDRDMLAAQARQAEAGLAAAQAAAEQAAAELQVGRRQAAADAAQARAQVRSAQVSLDQAGTTSRYQGVSQSERVRQAQAELAQARAELELVEKSRPELIAQARADLAEAEAVAGKAQSDFDRAQRLQERGFIPASELEAARFSLAIGQARLEAARERLKRVESGSQQHVVEAARQRVASLDAALALAKAGEYQATASRQEIGRRQAELQRSAADLARTAGVSATIRPAEENVAAARAQVERAAAALAAARSALAASDIRSPFSGVVVAAHAHRGELATRGAPLFALLDRDKPCWVKAPFSEYQIARIKPGQPATITMGPYGRRVFRGRVTTVGDVAVARNPSSSSSGGRERPAGSAAEIAVQLSLDSQGLRMVPGVSARVIIRVR